MANDTSINRSSPSDPAVSTTRKKQNSGIDLSQQSFFEELLTIGQFQSVVPETTTLPVAKPAVSDVSSQGEADKKVDRESNKEPTQPDEAANSSQVQAVLAAQAIAPQIQQSTPQIAKESVSGEKGDKPQTKAIHKKNGDEKADSRKSATGPTDADSVAKVTDVSDKDLATPVKADNLTATTTGVASSESGPQLTDGDGKVLVDKKNPAQSVQKGRATADSSDGKGAQTKSESESLQLASKQTQSNSKPGIALKDFDSAKQSVHEPNKSDITEGIADQPRNKRAERLAQRASDGRTSTDDHESSVDPTLELQPATATKPIESSFTASTASESTLQSSATVPTSTTPVIVQPITISSPGAATVSRSSAESIVGVNASGTASGSQTGISNTTISGNVASPGRADQGRSEVARSNSGTQISAYQEGKLVQRVLRGIEQLANGGGQVRLRLHPPELGALQMSLRMEGGQVFAKLEVENTTARDALLNNVQTLKDRMADQGMKIAAFEVEVSTDSAGSGLGSSSSQADGGSGNQSRWENSSSRFAQQNSNRLPTEPVQAERKPNAGWTRTNGSLDLTV